MAKIGPALAARLNSVRDNDVLEVVIFLKAEPAQSQLSSLDAAEPNFSREDAVRNMEQAAQPARRRCSIT